MHNNRHIKKAVLAAKLQAAREALAAWREIRKDMLGNKTVQAFAKERIEDILTRYPQLS